VVENDLSRLNVSETQANTSTFRIDHVKIHWRSNLGNTSMQRDESSDDLFAIDDGELSQ